ncbi:hypothetical protein ACWGI8_16930, partial [Streptomyces sp. NPDC054841]
NGVFGMSRSPRLVLSGTSLDAPDVRELADFYRRCSAGRWRHRSRSRRASRAQQDPPDRP